METEILYGFHSVFEALKANRRKFFELCIPNISNTLKKQNKYLKIYNLANALKLNIKESKDFKDFKEIGLKASAYPTLDILDIINNNNSNSLFLLILDGILDVNNLGALIRTAVCVGINGIIIPKDKSAPLSPAVSKSSAGALEHALISKVTNLTNTIKLLKQKNIWIFGADKNAKKSIFEVFQVNNFDNLKNTSIGLVIGGEENGIRRLVKEQIDFLISIPQANTIDSLNASVAGGVIMYEIFKQKNINSI